MSIEVVNGGLPDGRNYFLVVVDSPDKPVRLMWGPSFDTHEAATGHAIGMIEAGEISHAFVITPELLVWNNPLR